MSDPGILAGRAGGPVTRAVGAAGSRIGFVLVVIFGLLAGDGWLYLLRGAGWFTAGPSVGDSLPLLQLAGFDGQPLLRVVVAWLLVGTLAGLALIRVRPLRRTVLAGVLGLLLLLLASQVSYALARNLRLTDILLSRSPGLGPWLEAVIFAVGCLLPRRFVSGAQRGRVRRVSAVGGPGGFGHLGLSGGERRDASEHDRDCRQVGDDRDGVRA
jgi:hypothetical protein